MRCHSYGFFSILLLLSVLWTSTLHAQNNVPAMGSVEEDLNSALETLQLSLAEARLPPMLLTRAEAIVIMPTIVRLALGIGGNFGQGVLLVRNANGWSLPSLLVLGGGSAGFQAGIDVSNVILLFMSRDGVSNMLNGSFTLGADIGLTAGPVGAGSEISTDFESEIYAYSRSKGLFAGLALEGTILKVDHNANAALYGRYLRPVDIFAGRATSNSIASNRLRNLLNNAAMLPR